VSNQAETQHVGLIGWPVEHSVSPAMFNAAFQAMDMNWRYTAYPLEPKHLAKGVTELRERGVRGFNVTVPHKQSVMGLLDTLKPDARIIGAVNTVSLIQGEIPQLQGTNTDGIGFYKDLTTHITAPVQNQHALVLGSGGAAHAAVYVLARLGYQIYIASRNPSRGLELIRNVQAGLTAINETQSQPIESTQWRMQMRTLPWSRIGQVDVDINLVVNCTPVGMWPDVDAAPWPGDIPLPATATVYDMVYRPARTKLIQNALDAGIPAYNGLGMLVEQGAAAFNLWTGQDAPTDVMYAAAERALRS
jgi:shikimate dehydrogenase